MSIKVKLSKKEAVNFFIRTRKKFDFTVKEAVRESSKELTSFVKNRFLSGAFSFRSSSRNRS